MSQRNFMLGMLVFKYSAKIYSQSESAKLAKHNFTRENFFIGSAPGEKEIEREREAKQIHSRSQKQLKIISSSRPPSTATATATAAATAADWSSVPS